MTQEETQATQEETQATQEETGGNPPSSLTINDLQQLVSIIDLASKRGAFQANELETVGTTYNRLTKFVEDINSASKGT